MRLVKVYQTADGGMFDNRRDAANHEKKVEIEKMIREILRISIGTGRAEAVVKEIIEEAVTVCNVLRSIKAPKVAKKAA